MEKKDASVKMCACGKPLHYSNAVLQRIVQRQVDEHGESVIVTVGDRRWRISRHFIALHGLRASELEQLGFPEVKDADL